MGKAFGEVAGGILREVTVSNEAAPLLLTDTQMAALRPVKFIGKGTTASAYLRDDDRVVKFTTDHQDVAAFAKAKGMPHVAETYAFYRLPQTVTLQNARMGEQTTFPVYAIVMKKYENLPMAMSHPLESLFTMWDMGGQFKPGRPDFKMFVIDPLESSMRRTKANNWPPYAMEDPVKYMLDFYNEVLAAQKHLQNNGINMTDLHRGNIMYDSDTSDWVFIDLGRSRFSPEKAVEVSTYLQGLARWWHTR